MTHDPIEGLNVFHHHIFKAGGTTLAGILESNFYPGVLYVESDGTSRLSPSYLRRQIPPGRFSAVTSHLSMVPTEGEELAKLHVSMVREPIARLISALQHGARTGGRSSYSESDMSERSTFRNFQVRQMTPGDFGRDEKDPWTAALEAIDLERPSLFLGVVERFDESLLVLREILAERGVPFDPRYRRRLNVTGDAESLVPPPWWRDGTREDHELWQRTNDRLSDLMRAFGLGRRELTVFRDDCAELPSSPNPFARVKGPATWVYLPTGESTRPAIGAPDLEPSVQLADAEESEAKSSELGANSSP